MKRWERCAGRHGTIRPLGLRRSWIGRTTGSSGKGWLLPVVDASMEMRPSGICGSNVCRRRSAS